MYHGPPLLCFALALGALIAAPTNSSAGAADDPLMSVHLAVDRDRYLLGEPVNLRVIVTLARNNWPSLLRSDTPTRLRVPGSSRDAPAALQRMGLLRRNSDVSAVLRGPA